MAQQQQGKRPSQSGQGQSPPPFMSETDQKALVQVMQPKSFEDWLKLCQLLAKSKIIPFEFRDKPENIMIAVSLGGTIGLHWSQSLNSVCVLGGKPTLYGDVGRAKVLESGDVEAYEEKWDPTLNGGTATITMKRRGFPAMTKSFSMDQARKVRIYKKDDQGRTIYKDNQPVFTTLADKDNYVNYGDEMCAWRARWRIWRALWADKLKGFVGREEYEEFAGARDVTPSKAELPEPKPKKDDATSSSVEAQGTTKMPELQPKQSEPEQVAGTDILKLDVWQECESCDFKGSPEEGLKHAMETQGKHTLINCSKEPEEGSIELSEEEQQIEFMLNRP